MPEQRTCHLPNIMALFCIGLDRLGLIEARHRAADIVVSDMTGLGGRR